jgi:hypothetical protein
LERVGCDPIPGDERATRGQRHGLRGEEAQAAVDEEIDREQTIFNKVDLDRVELDLGKVEAA